MSAASRRSGRRNASPPSSSARRSSHATVLVNGGRRGLQIEIAPADLVRASPRRPPTYAEPRASLTPFDFLLYAHGRSGLGTSPGSASISRSALSRRTFRCSGASCSRASSCWDSLRCAATALRLRPAQHADVRACSGSLLFSLNFLLFYMQPRLCRRACCRSCFRSPRSSTYGSARFFSACRSIGAWSVGGLLGAAGMAAMFYPQFAGARLKHGALMALLAMRVGTFPSASATCFRPRCSGAEFRSLRRPVTRCCMAAPRLPSTRLLHGHAFIVEWTPAYLIALVYLALVGRSSRSRAI